MPTPHTPRTSTPRPGAPRRADFHVAVDICLFSLRNDLLHIGVVQRRGPDACIDLNHVARRRSHDAPRRIVEVPRDPDHHWALPGGHVGHTLLGDDYGTGPEPDASLEAAAVRVLARETAISLRMDELHQVGAFGDANRDPRSGHTVSVAYLAVAGDDRDVARHPDDAVGHVSRVQFRPVVDVLSRPNQLEFDHEDILMRAIGLLRSLVITTPLATRFCRPEFTMGELRRVYEVIFHESLDSAHNAERFAPKVREYLKKLEEIGGEQGRELEQTVSELAMLLPYARHDADLFIDDQPLEIKSKSRRSATPSARVMLQRAMPSTDLARQAELLSRLVRQSSGMKPPRPPRMLKSLDPTNFARKIQKLGILEPVEGESRPTFERYGKPAALFRLNQRRENTPFLLRLDGLTKGDSPDSTD